MDDLHGVLAEASQYSAVSDACARYPKQAGPLFHAFRDLTLCPSAKATALIILAQRWLDVQLREVPALELCLIEGRAVHDVRQPF